jgi:hypothetical protein
VAYQAWLRDRNGEIEGDLTWRASRWLHWLNSSAKKVALRALDRYDYRRDLVVEADDLARYESARQARTATNVFVEKLLVEE